MNPEPLPLVTGTGLWLQGDAVRLRTLGGPASPAGGKPDGDLDFGSLVTRAGVRPRARRPLRTLPG